MAVRNSSHMGFWLVVVLVGFLATPLMRNGADMESFVRDEVKQTRSALGDTAADYVVSFAAGVFESTPLGMVAQVAKTTQHTAAEKKLSFDAAGATGLVISSLFNSYMQGLVLQSFVVAMRFAIVIIWALILAPLIFAAAYDGFMQRKIKRSEFGALRPATYTLAGLIVIPLLALPAVYLVIPYSLSPLLAPMWAFVVALPLSIMISNMQPLFGR